MTIELFVWIQDGCLANTIFTLNPSNHVLKRLWCIFLISFKYQLYGFQGPVVQSVVSLTSLLRVISLTVLADSIYNILIFFAEKFFSAKKFQHICISLNVNFNESLTNDIVSFEQPGPEILHCFYKKKESEACLAIYCKVDIYFSFFFIIYLLD